LPALDLLETAAVTKLLAALSAVAALAVTPALAADMAVKAPPLPPPAVYSWTGCYLGGNGGVLFAHKTWTNLTSGIVQADENVDGGLAGVQAGCNYQFASRWVVGVQGDYDWSDATGSYMNPTTGSTYNTNIRSLASVTGRVGYAWDRLLGYVKGGGAWERDNYNLTSNTTNLITSVASETRSGWTGGVGIEYAFTNFVTGFVEYDYYDFGTRTVPFTVLANGGIVQRDIKEYKNIVKAGLSLKWGG
jgi:outer membrane immunogenic protein